MQHGGEGGIWTLATLSRPTPLAGEIYIVFLQKFMQKWEQKSYLFQHIQHNIIKLRRADLQLCAARSERFGEYAVAGYII